MASNLSQKRPASQRTVPQWWCESDVAFFVYYTNFTTFVWIGKIGVLEANITQDKQYNLYGGIEVTFCSLILSRGYDLLSCGHDLLSCGLKILSRGHELLSCGHDLLSRGLKILSRGHDLLSCGLKILSRSHDLLSCGLKILSRGHELLSCGHDLLFRCHDLLSCGHDLLKPIKMVVSSWIKVNITTTIYHTGQSATRAAGQTLY
jgi:hypothetical protein